MDVEEEEQEEKEEEDNKEEEETITHKDGGGKRESDGVEGRRRAEQIAEPPAYLRLYLRACARWFDIVM